MTRTVLAPSSTGSVKPDIPVPRAVPTSRDWDALYPEIQRLYVRERRKLRYVMQYVETKYGFKATEPSNIGVTPAAHRLQMYKKRFTQWGLRKSSRHKAPKCSSPQVLKIADPMANLSLRTDDSLMLKLLTNVHSWSVSFYESPLPECKATSSSVEPEKCHDISPMFKLVTDMLERGHGSLAGRVARKAFLQIEELLILEGPALVWNLLEILHYMLSLQHEQLFQMLVAHLIALVGDRMPAKHPLMTILRSLHGLGTQSRGAMSSSVDSSAALPSESGEQRKSISDAISFIIESAWTLNAELLFRSLDSRRFPMYVCINWESCSIAPPKAIISASRRWLERVQWLPYDGSTAKASVADAFWRRLSSSPDMILQQMLATLNNAPSLLDYESLQMSSIAALVSHASSVTETHAQSSIDTTEVLRVLAVLMTAKTIEDSDTSNIQSNMLCTASGVPCLPGKNLLYMIRMLMELGASANGFEPPAHTLEGMRTVLALRARLVPDTDPQVIRDLFSLEDALTAAGQEQEAQKTRKSAYLRLRKHIQDIPVESI